jgi:dTDP-4-amino-4,6-dideoxy-D-galactose acyltransferase
LNAELCEYLPWDSRFFEKRIARITASRLTDQDVESAIAWCDANHIDCLYVLADVADDATVRSIEKRGFHLVDVRVTKEHGRIGGLDLDSRQRELEIRGALPDDIPALKAIARVSHRDSRFCFDENFGPERGAALFEEWIEKSCNGWAEAVLVGVRDGRAVGYISCHRESPTDGKIGLLAVSNEVRGQGYGVALVNAALAWFKHDGMSRVTVVTQGRNVAAQRLYQRCGFVTRTVQLWYHHWRSAGAAFTG